MSFLSFLAKKKPVDHLQSAFRALESGDSQQAQKDFVKALELAESYEDYDTIGKASLELAHLHEQQGSYVIAEKHYRKAVQVFDDSDDYVNCARSLSDAGNMYIKMCKFAEAEQTLKYAINVCQQNFGANDARAAQAAESLAVCYLSKGHMDAAENVLKTALRIYENADGKDSLSVARVAASLGHCYAENGKPSEAEELYSLAIPLFENHRERLGQQELQSLCRCYHETARILVKAQQLPLAEGAFKKAMALREEVLYALEAELLAEAKQFETI
jgi:tetratricopeptide (TPR) repeat protein